LDLREWEGKCIDENLERMENQSKYILILGREPGTSGIATGRSEGK
jgi:hypothetical protein